MSSSIVLTITLAILSVGDGRAVVGGEASGLLEPGDVGQIFYRLTVGAESHRIEVGPARVVSVGAGRAVLEPAAAAEEVRPGHRVEWTVPYERLGDSAPERAAALAALERRLAERTAELAAARRQLATAETERAALAAEVEALVFVLGERLTAKAP